MPRPPVWSQSVLGSLDPKAIAEMDRLVAFLAFHWPFSHLVELHEVFGKELLVRFLEVFAGTTLRVPTKEAVSSAVRDHSFYEALARGEDARALSKAHGLSVAEVYKAARQVEEFYAALHGKRSLADTDAFAEALEEPEEDE